MMAVATRAGVAIGSVYRHFPGKAQLVAELFRVVVNREMAAVEQAAIQAGDLVEQVAAVIECFASRALKAPRLAYALLAEPVAPEVDAARLEYRRAFRDALADDIAEGVRRGVLPPQDPQVSAAALVGAAAEALVGPLAAGGAGPDIVPYLVDFAIRALGMQGDRHARNP